MMDQFLTNILTVVGLVLGGGVIGAIVFGVIIKGIIAAQPAPIINNTAEAHADGGGGGGIGLAATVVPLLIVGVVGYAIIESFSQDRQAENIRQAANGQSTQQAQRATDIAWQLMLDVTKAPSSVPATIAPTMAATIEPATIEPTMAATVAPATIVPTLVKVTAVATMPATTVPARQPVGRPVIDPILVPAIAILATLAIGIWSYALALFIRRRKASAAAGSMIASTTTADGDEWMEADPKDTHESVDERLRKRRRESELERAIPSVVFDLDKEAD